MNPSIPFTPYNYQGLKKKLSLLHFMLIPVRQQNTHNLQKG